jgi:cytochrome c
MATNLGENMRFAISAAALACIASTSASYAAGNAASGAAVFNRCAICHDNRKGGINKIGPNLFGVVGRKAGTYAGFSYSPAMSSASIVWTNEKLDAYVTSPQRVVPGNKMAFAGISEASQRADLVAYLDTLR